MTPAIREFLLAVSNSLAASIVAKVTVATAMGLVAAWLARGNRAAVRHTLLAATFGVTLLLPVAAVVMPSLRVSVPVGMQTRVATLPLVLGVDASPPATAGGAGARVIAGAPLRQRLSLANLLFAGWGAGVVLFLLPVFIGLWQIRSLCRSGLPWRRGQSVAEMVAVDLGIHRRVEVLLHEELPGPMTCGVLRPVIVLPRDAETWDPDDLTRAIVHELEHVRRGDSVSRCFARGICAMYWFHPLIWIAWRKLALEAERSCDDAVLRRSEAAAYADQLVELAKRLSVRQRSPLLAMASRADLATRVCAVLDGRQRRGRAGMLPVALVCAGGVVLVTAVSPVRLVAAPQSVVTTAPAGARPQAEFDVVSIRPNRTFPGRSGGGLRYLQGMVASGPGGVTLKQLITAAYHLTEYQVSGGPGWIDSEAFELEAKTPAAQRACVGPTCQPPDEIRQMLQTLLADRFKLVLSRGTKEMPVYALVVARNGPTRNLHKLKEGETAPKPDDGFHYTGGAIPEHAGGPGVRLGGNQGISMQSFADLLPQTFPAGDGFQTLDRPVLNRTGLDGRYYFRLFWKDPEDFPSALEDELGLRLAAQKAPMDVLVVDHVEKPSEN